MLHSSAQHSVYELLKQYWSVGIAFVKIVVKKNLLKVSVFK